MTSFKMDKDMFVFLINKNIDKLQYTYKNSESPENEKKYIFQELFKQKSKSFRFYDQHKNLHWICFELEYLMDDLTIYIRTEPFEEYGPDGIYNIHSVTYSYFDIDDYDHGIGFHDLDNLYYQFNLALNNIQKCKICSNIKINTDLFNDICLDCNDNKLIIYNDLGDCLICHEKIKTDVNMLLCCNNIFHKKCISTHIKTNDTKCPLCKK